MISFEKASEIWGEMLGVALKGPDRVGAEGC